MSASHTPREWDAESYHAVATPHQGWGAEILDRLTLRGDETVLDLGCGTGRVSAQLLERLGPKGHVIGVDGSAAMVAEAQRRLGGERARVRPAGPPGADRRGARRRRGLQRHLPLDRRPRPALRARPRRAAAEGAPFVAQCGGRGNIASIVAVVEEVTARAPFAATFAGWPGPWNYAGPEETAERLERAGFAVEPRAGSTRRPSARHRLREFLRTVSLGAHLSSGWRRRSARPFLDAVLEGLGPDPVHDYVRLNIVATAR